MLKEHKILVITWAALIIILLWLVPGNKIREAIAIFLFKQSVTWVLGLIAVELKLIKYPVREFQRATKTSFTFEYFAYPAICVIFNLYYPFGESILNQFIHYFFYTTGITVFEVLLEKHTDLVDYMKWKWYWTWASIFITFLMSNLFYRWFFQIN